MRKAREIFGSELKVTLKKRDLVDQKWQKNYMPELKDEIQQKERILIQIFPEFNA